MAWIFIDMPSSVTRTNHILWSMGTDLHYPNAESWFKEIDKLIHFVNQDGRVNVFYSTLSTYTDAKNAANQSWPVKTDDYFPYADSPIVYWTGYFTSRPALKRYIRYLSGYYQVKVPVWVDGQEEMEFVGVGARFSLALESKEKRANQMRVAADPTDCCSNQRNKCAGNVAL